MTEITNGFTEPKSERATEILGWNTMSYMHGSLLLRGQARKPVRTSTFWPNRGRFPPKHKHYDSGCQSSCFGPAGHLGMHLGMYLARGVQQSFVRVSSHFFTLLHARLHFSHFGHDMGREVAAVQPNRPACVLGPLAAGLHPQVPHAHPS